MKTLNTYISEAERAFGITKYISEAERILCLHGYITEKFRISKDCLNQVEYNYHPKSRNELKALIIKLIKERGKNADLNDIDTSEITDMSYLFNYKELINFDGDISKWDVSNVKEMIIMFGNSKFNGDISQWDVSKVEYMDDNMFYGCPLENNPPKWYKK